MSTFATQAIVLAKKEWREDDRLYILYTPEYGKIEAQVKAAASSKSKLAGALEPICKTEIMVVNGKNMETIAGSQLIKKFVFKNLFIQGQLALVRELFCRLVKPGFTQHQFGAGFTDPVLYHKLESYLDVLAELENESAAIFYTQRFIWQMIKILGYAPAGSAKIDLPGLVQVSHFSAAALALWQLCLQENGNRQAKPEANVKILTSTALQELERFTHKFLKYFLESDLRSVNFKLPRYA